MAQKVQVLLVDDMDGGEAAETVTFALDGKFYEIDLNPSNAEKLRRMLEPWRCVARPAGTDNLQAKGASAGRATFFTQPDESAKIREWAKANNIPVNDRGRVNIKVRDAYEAALRGEDYLLRALLEESGQDPNRTPAPQKTISTKPESPKAPIRGEDRHRKRAEQAGRLSRAQLARLRKAYADDNGIAISSGKSEATSYEALACRGLLDEIEDNVYRITPAGRCWFEVNSIDPTP